MYENIVQKDMNKFKKGITFKFHDFFDQAFKDLSPRYFITNR